MTELRSRYPLEGLKVLDFSRVLAGPFAGRMLADLGADVVKIEPPDGDSTRLWGQQVGGLSSYYSLVNAGKRNISIDLRAEGATQLVFELVARADVIIENFRPDVMDRLGLGYEAVSQVNPRIVMVSISGFGRGGPESHRPAYAAIVHAELGLIERAARRGGPRQELPLSMADTNAGLHGLVGLLSALLMREQTGLGQHIDISMLDATLVTDDQLHYEMDGSEETRPQLPDIWETGAGPILISADFRHLWKLLAELFSIKDPSGPDMEPDVEVAERRRIVAEFMSGLTSWEAVGTTMSRMNLAWGRVRTGELVHEQPTLIHRGAFACIDDRVGGMRTIQQSPYRFSQASSGVRGPASYRGEHNDAVLAEWLGKSRKDVAALHSAGVLRRGEAQTAPISPQTQEKP